MKVSVCMATYNREKFIKEQLDSILCQLGDNDELIISDDNSTDKTVEIINSYYDNRIKIYKNQLFNSPIFNFENAIKYATGDIIVRADQDDIWEYDKLEIVQKEFKKYSNEIMFMMCNGVCIDENQKMIKNDFFEKSYKQISDDIKNMYCLDSLINDIFYVEGKINL